jgi:hypothetical protein
MFSCLFREDIGVVNGDTEWIGSPKNEGDVVYALFDHSTKGYNTKRWYCYTIHHDAMYVAEVPEVVRLAHMLLT